MPTAMPARSPEAPARRAAVAAVALLVLLNGAPARAQAPATDAGALAAELARVRRSAACGAAATDDTARGLVHRGRPATGVTGREPAGDGDGPGRIRDFSIFDAAAGGVVTYVCFANASTRKAGEPIISLAEISTVADAGARALLPGAPLALESIQRYRTSGEQGVYYEARYAPTAGDPPFLEAPVRLLLNASNGALFRMDVDPDWADPPPVQRLQISRKAAERIARVVLGKLDLAAVFAGAVSVASVGSAELFMVRGNAAFGPAPASGEGRAQQAWVVPFRTAGAAAAAHALFIDASTGRVLGGSSGLEDAAREVEPAGLRGTR